jgi:iron-sulfur cluster repair protein YtfE (RIC family)
MLRDPALIPLSHQHQHALALCVRIDRASPIPDSDLPAWLAEINQHFQHEILVHFAAEEQVVFPAARRFTDLILLIDELVTDHESLRASFQAATAGTLLPRELPAFAQRLSAHIRKEERQLFELMQQLLSAEQLADLGKQLAAVLKDADNACLLPNETTKLRPRG